MRKRYADQVGLLVRAVPVIAGEDVFALKGGTAINLFYRDMPRLSVDIDLTYLPLDQRRAALGQIDAAFARMSARARELLPDVEVTRIAGGGGGDTRMLLRTRDAQVKVEVSPVTRGTVGEPRRMRVTEPVEEEFGFAETLVVSFEDLYAGKLVAALDRQHPRDLFDVRLLYEHEGLTPGLFGAFLVYAACSSRPLHELIAPHRLDIARTFTQEFAGMPIEPVALEALLETRERLIADVQSRLIGQAAEFVLSVHDGTPNFALIGLDAAAALPAVRWKLLNLEQLRTRNPAKHAAQRAALEQALAKG
jgi:hypothetical protein